MRRGSGTLRRVGWAIAALLLAPAIASADEPEVAPPAFPAPPNPPPIAPRAPTQPPRMVTNDLAYAEDVPSSWLYPERLAFVEGRPAPDGYRYDETADARLLAPGLTMLLTGWALSCGVASILAVDTKSGSGASSSSSSNVSGYIPLVIPIAGPFVVLGTRKSSFNEDATPTLILVSDGLVQGIGGILLLAAVTAPRKGYVRVTQARAIPNVKIGARAFSATWQF